MHECVDKQVSAEIRVGELVIRRLFLGDIKAYDYLAALNARFIRKHVRHVVFVAERDIHRLRAGRTDEGERNVPAGKRSRGRLRIRKTRRGAPRHIPYIKRGHKKSIGHLQTDADARYGEAGEEGVWGIRRNKTLWERVLSVGPIPKQPRRVECTIASLRPGREERRDQSCRASPVR